MVPTFEQRERILAVGCAGEFHPGATEDIGALWDRFVPQMADIPGRVGAATYGICCQPEEGQQEPGRFTYIAAVEVENLNGIPDGMTGIELPAHEYAVFAYSDGIGPELPKAMEYIFGEWLPSSEYELDGTDFEYYGDDFDPATLSGTILIYLPIKRRQGSK
jgi:AraC family transcriptional regulator